MNTLSTLTVLLFVAVAPTLKAQTLAFPGAEGFGALATGGRAGDVYRVTTLDDSGPGSFRDAVSQPNRIVVFDVGGVIKLNSNVSVASNITIAGQSAPGQGVCLYNRSLSLSGSSNIIIRYLRVREGINGDRGKCSINMAGSSKIILDHCSIEWGRWDCMGITQGSHDITVQNCIIGESIDPQRFGALVDSVTNVTLSHNLWIHNQSRNPKAKGTIQYINNVIYNWGGTGLAGGHSAADHYLDAINNYLIKGPSSDDTAIGGFTATDKVFQNGNLVDLDRNGQLNGRAVVESDFTDSKGSPTIAPQSWGKSPVPVTIDSAKVAYEKAVAGAGCSLHRDAIDQRLIDELKSLGAQGKIIHSEEEVGGICQIKGGTPPTSSAGDGIPDAWKKAHGLDVNDKNAYKADRNGDGYTNLEEYLNELAGSANEKTD